MGEFAASRTPHQGAKVTLSTDQAALARRQIRRRVESGALTLAEGMEIVAMLGIRAQDTGEAVHLSELDRAVWS